MDLQHLIQQMEHLHPEPSAPVVDRRHILQRFAAAGKILVRSVLPFSLGSMFKQAHAAYPDNIIEILQQLLQLEYLQSAFYATGLMASGLIPPGRERSLLTAVSAHENAHVVYLQQALKGTGISPHPSPVFDFTANGAFPDIFRSYAVFLAVAQALEDASVRAYKGQVQQLSIQSELLTALLSIHTAEARHAAHIRYIRRHHGTFGASDNLKPWITLDESGISSDMADLIYFKEKNTLQGGVETSNIFPDSSAALASEAFDEPLPAEEVQHIIRLFIKL